MCMINNCRCAHVEAFEATGEFAPVQVRSAVKRVCLIALLISHVYMQ